MTLVPTAHAVLITINTNLPGTSTAAQGIGGVVANFYSFALMMAGILAFGAIVYGGIKYAVGRGNPTSESEGKSWVTNALLGLLLLAGAWIILYTVNPQIVNLPQGFALPALHEVPPANNGSITGQTGTVFCTGSTRGVCSISSQVCNCTGGSCSCVSTSTFTCGNVTLGISGTCSGSQYCASGASSGTGPPYSCHT